MQVYRGGYSPAERRDLERRLHCGELLAVAATNALELGVDVGCLDVTLHLGGRRCWSNAMFAGAMLCVRAAAPV